MLPPDFDIDEVLSKLSVSQKVKLLCGKGWWHTEPIPEVGVPSMRMSDGPNGVRGTRFFNGVPSSAFPSSTGLGSSFDIDLAEEVGKALADECRAKGCHILLGPTVNTQRSPLGGRGFESFSEDPVLNGTIAAAYINGLQSKGVSATIKHFVANDQEFERFSISADVSERALREIYLKPFQIALKKGNPWAFMSSYNRVNGLHVSEDKRLLNDVLRKEWGFDGLIMSDWIGVYSTTASIKAGLDLEMPGPTAMRGRAIERAMAGGKLDVSDLDFCVRHILGLLKRAYASGIPFDGPEEGLDTPEVRALLRRASADATVLLKNDKGVLPLKPSTKSIAVIGPNAKYAMTSGGGSARLLSTYTISPLEGIEGEAKKIGAEVRYKIGATSHKYLPLLDGYIKQANGEPGALVEFWNEEPSEDFTSVQANLSSSMKPAVWSTPTKSTTCFLMDGIDASKVNYKCWIRFSTKFTPDESGDWDFGLNLAGRGNLFLDGKLVIDLSTNPELGEAFFGLGTVDVKTTVKGLKAGQTYDLEIRINSADFQARSSPFECYGGIRLGAMPSTDPEVAIREAVEVAKASDVALLIIGLNHDWESEGFDRQDMKLPGLTNRLVSEVLKANPNTVVVNQSGTPVEMPWIDEAHTLLQAFYGGNEVGTGLADVLFGNVNPSGKLALTFPKRLEDSPSHLFFGNQGETPGRVLYNEGIYVGYRGFEKRDLAPLFPFGYGITYSSFEYSDLSLSPLSDKGDLTVTFKIKNTSGIAGREVAQVYVTDPESTAPRPAKELKGFTKVALQLGETKTATVALDKDAFSYYDERKAAWVAEKGKFGIWVGASSADIKLKGEAELKKTFTWTGL
ncbi:glycoside hydrolase family 3 protein [Schizophyllum commune H4-8]|uniref:glycoside hydrolase family 3 protein n=1 Tax=Schizophyllum commune (strain H4-8 / FGSC 9210) TaxID=578458 RepID=UPI0021602586|nr:glycoside hydrolase family 3 protein [Schizophyllum commune H4-8]KAI5894000.1 glycoside hydrolase family 3 protein [Schizophyllum commune H4-8]